MNDRPDFSRAGSSLSNGLVIGTFVGRDRSGDAIVSVPDGIENRLVTARAATMLEASDFGADVVVMFEGGDPERVIILGRLLHPKPVHAENVAATLDGERLELSAEREIVLRCGKASITLTRTGKIILRGTYILSRSSGPNKIKGGSIQLN
ncbi:DUF6484 domain-containing protein [Mesorhizobium captivum]|uniref:DUF6484 domain-containing protein n=1 Tax=Mesorhizobium captivum TaxID=3072319 RepID=UPI002A23AB36|nr:DUF6484 domain-containing protein [Mesorhizobium sp. VK23E]MDX8514037.1 DUF6484 domain-containing protein [Mesorhizobium sp. VK23E]